MKYCDRCGRALTDSAKECPSCGNNLQKSGKASSFSDKLYALCKTRDYSPKFAPVDVEQNKVMAILAYLSILVLIPIFAAPKSKFARFHANQGLILFVLEVVFGAIGTGISLLLGLIVWWLGAFFAWLFGLVGVALFAASILGIVNTVNGKAKEIPIVGRFRLYR